jgi:hypothetical protein
MIRRVRRGPAPSQPSPNDHQAAAKPLDKSTLVPLVGDALDDIAQHVDGCFVVVVWVSGGKYRRRCFLTVAAAERAARNAQDAGHTAEVFLAELRPLWRLACGSVAR